MRTTRNYQLYRERENAVIAGVCAGIAEYFNVPLAHTRVVALLGLFFFSPLFFTGYVVLSFILPKRPKGKRRSSVEEAFWRDVTFDPRNKIKEIKFKSYALSERLKKMEDYVTSNEFEWDKNQRHF